MKIINVLLSLALITTHLLQASIWTITATPDHAIVKIGLDKIVYNMKTPDRYLVCNHDEKDKFLVDKNLQEFLKTMCKNCPSEKDNDKTRYEFQVILDNKNLIRDFVCWKITANDKFETITLLQESHLPITLTSDGEKLTLDMNEKSSQEN